MNKIAELTQEQITTLQEVVDNIDYGSHSFDDLFMEYLKIADAQGLLTKEASLALNKKD